MMAKKRPSPGIEISMTAREEDIILTMYRELFEELLAEAEITEEDIEEMLEKLREGRERFEEKREAKGEEEEEGGEMLDGGVIEKSDLERLLEHKRPKRWWYEVYYTPKDTRLEDELEGL